ncbi:methyltransferase domain-containing protein [Amycolatopsis sp. NPDC004079]|uniref:class I SAM-dependent methyltransferase n=1 Tax=Amycolatopsis sp. NPDC004079 TaxID=3154549 RepID=UPI0033A8BD8E
MAVVQTWLTDTRNSYDTVADSYADRLRDSIAQSPSLRMTLGLFASQVHGNGPVADVGCGTGHVTAHLNSLGLDAFGLDLSSGMIEVARRDHPALRFAVGSMTALPLPDASAAGVLSWWALIHVPDEEVPTAIAEFYRVLRPGAPVAIGFHVGDVARLKTQGYGGHAMRLYVHRRRPAQVSEWLREAGFTVNAEWVEELDSEVPQAVVYARRPA